MYHSWMQQQALLDLTASDRMTLEQEYANQISWTQDPTSQPSTSPPPPNPHPLPPLTPSPPLSPEVTFIILDPSLPPTPLPSCSLGAMCGDVNLFLHPYLSPSAELEIMIAEPASRHKGIATDALHLMMQFARSAYTVPSFVVKVGGGNEASLALFKKLGFEVVEYVEVFDEYELRYAG